MVASDFPPHVHPSGSGFDALWGEAEECVCPEGSVTPLNGIECSDRSQKSPIVVLSLSAVSLLIVDRALRRLL